MDWKSDSFSFIMPKDIVASIGEKLGCDWNTLSATFELKPLRDGREAENWISGFDEDDREKIEEAVRLICSPGLVADVMQVEDDIVAMYRVLSGEDGDESPILLISEGDGGDYSCSLKKSKYVFYEELFPVINTDHPYWETPFAFGLDRREFLVLHAIVDLNQRYRYSAMLEQKPYDRRLRISDLEKTLEISSSSPDWRWMVPFIVACTPRLPKAPAGKELMESLEILSREGFIYMDSDRTQVALGESGNFYGDSVSRRYSTLSINRLSYDSSGNHVGEGVLFISSDKFLWTVDTGWLADDKILASAIDERIVEEIIDDMFSPTGKPRLMESPRIGMADKPEADEANLEETQKIEIDDTMKMDAVPKMIFCRECGKQIPAESRFCRHCGTKLK
jgi:hypothetical protein